MPRPRGRKIQPSVSSRRRRRRSARSMASTTCVTHGLGAPRPASTIPRLSPPASAAPRQAASMTPPYPPQTTRAPRRARWRPSSRASSYEESGSAGRLEPKTPIEIKASVQVDVPDRLRRVALRLLEELLRTSGSGRPSWTSRPRPRRRTSSRAPRRAPFRAPIASSTEPNLRGVFGASCAMTAFSSGSILSRALQQGQSSSKSTLRSLVLAGGRPTSPLKRTALAAARCGPGGRASSRGESSRSSRRASTTSGGGGGVTSS